MRKKKSKRMLSSFFLPNVVSWLLVQGPCCAAARNYLLPRSVSHMFKNGHNIPIKLVFPPFSASDSRLPPLEIRCERLRKNRISGMACLSYDRLI